MTPFNGEKPLRHKASLGFNELETETLIMQEEKRGIRSTVDSD